jgi:hypothetical protein
MTRKEVLKLTSWLDCMNSRTPVTTNENHAKTYRLVLFTSSTLYSIYLLNFKSILVVSAYEL